MTGGGFSRKELVYTVYQEGSISKAAQKLFISQPSLSVMIQKVEQELEVPLFDRTSKPLRLTEAGQAYIKATETIMETEKSFYDFLQSYRDLEAGTLTIGSNQLLSSLVLPKYISEFISHYPKIHLELVDDNSTVLEEMISAGKLDLVLDNHPLDPAIFYQHVLRQENLLLAVPRTMDCNQGLEDYAISHRDIIEGKHLTEQFRPVDLRRFERVPFITMTKQNNTRHRTNEILREAGIKPQTILEIGRLATLYSFIEEGSAASVVSDTLVQHLQRESRDVVFYKLSSQHASRNLYLSYKRGRYYSKAMKAFTDLMEKFRL